MSIHPLPLARPAKIHPFISTEPNRLNQPTKAGRESGLGTRATGRHLEVDGACIVVNSLQECGGEAEVHRKRRYIRLGAAQLAQGTHRQRFQRHVPRAAREVQNSLVAAKRGGPG